MLRLTTRTTLACTLGFFLFIGVIRAQSYQPDRLWDVLPNTGDCRKPCWQHIRPGFTTTTEALALLEDHHWVGDISHDGELIEWTWSGRQSAYIDSSQPGTIRVQNNRVISVQIATTAGMGDFALLLGYPTWNSTNRTSGQANIGLSYPGEYLSLSVHMTCPTTRAQFWMSRPQIELRNFPRAGARFTSGLFGRSIAC